MAPAASAATAITLYAGAGTAAAGVVGALASAVWYFAGFGKIKCPACTKKVFARDYHEHAKNHPYDCPSCENAVPFPDMEEHFKTHGYTCPVCLKFVPMTDLAEHVMSHAYACPRCNKAIPFADMEAHFQIHAAEEDEYSRRRQEVSVLWGFLKAQCPICKAGVCLRDIGSHAAIHWMQRNGNAIRQEGLANMQSNGRSTGRRGFKVRSLMKKMGR